MLENNLENREELASSIINSMDEEEIKSMAYKLLILLYESNNSHFEYDSNCYLKKESKSCNNI